MGSWESTDQEIIGAFFLNHLGVSGEINWNSESTRKLLLLIFYLDMEIQRKEKHYKHKFTQQGFYTVFAFSKILIFFFTGG